MQTLPLELHEHIFTYVLPHIGQKDVTAAPVYDKAERIDVYNVRLTSQRLRTGASTAFVRIVGHIPTECTPDSLQKLASLVALPEIGDSLGCLTLNTCKAFYGPGHVMNAHAAWLRDMLEQNLLAIFEKLPRLRHLRCVVEAIRGVRNLGMYLKGHVSMATDPMRVSHSLQRVMIERRSCWITTS
jgi:hypothetical protein